MVTKYPHKTNYVMHIDSLRTPAKADTIDMVKDILQGDVNLTEDKRFATFDLETMKEALALLRKVDVNGDYADDIENNGWRLMYYRKPPTPEEFLTYEWIGPQAETLWPNLRKCFIEFMDPSPLCSYRNLALSVSIGWGKQQPVSSDIVVGKTIDVELEDGKTVHIPSDERIDVLKNGQSIKVKANDLLKEDLSGLDLPQLSLGMKIKSVSYSYQKKQLKDISIGEKVLNVDGDYASVWNIQKNGGQQTYLIKLSDGREFRVGRNHLNLIHFRNSKNRTDKKVYDVVPIEYIKDHLGTYVFEIPTEDTFSLKDLDFIQHLEMLPCHEYEPTNEKDILPDRVKDPSKVYIESVIDCGEEECWCLQLNDPLGLYITEQGIITHNSLMTVLVLTYIAILFGMMRKPYKLLGHSISTSYSLCMCAATLGKSSDLLLVPFEQLIENSPYFEKVGRHDDITAVNREDRECKKCYYSTASHSTAKMTFRNNLSLKLMSTEGALLGNAQPLYSKIMKPDGSYYTMGDVKIGDKIASPTEKETEVIGVFPQGKRPIYEIELEDGRKVRSSDNHLWKVAIDKINGKWNWQVVNTLQLIDWLQEGKEIEIYDESNAREVIL